MHTCTICHFETELDDLAVAMTGDRCICLRCFGRETSSGLCMPKHLRREIIVALATVDVA